MSTKAAVESLRDTGEVLLTSVGLNTWELTLHLANLAGVPQIVILPDGPDIPARIKGIKEDFCLAEEKVSFLLLDLSKLKKSTGQKWWWPARDAVAVELADRIMPVSLRKGSKLAALLEAVTGSDKVVDDSFRCPHKGGGDRVSYKFDRARLNPVFASGWPYVTHWTRSAQGPLPGERSCDFYSDLLAADRYPRAAIDVLSRIVVEQKLRASGRFLREGRRAVAFTSQNPIDAIDLMRWRRRYVYYNFEPFGIAIEKSVAREIGIRPVIYGPASKYDKLEPADRPYFQNQGIGDADWLEEYELRCLGDVDLGSLPSDAVRLIVYGKQDIENLPANLPYEVIPLMI